MWTVWPSFFWWGCTRLLKTMHQIIEDNALHEHMI
nr:MAG TPA: hypothetical protein [Caudoviricetes sp.]